MSTTHPLYIHDSLRSIFERLPRTSLWACITTCKFWREVGTSDELWKILYERDFASFNPRPEPTIDESLEQLANTTTTTQEKETPAPQLDEATVSALMRMGFLRVQAERACVQAKGNVQHATEWLLSHIDDPIINVPLPSRPEPRDDEGLDPEVLTQLTLMGFPRVSCIWALRISSGDAEKAATWLLSNPDDIIRIEQEHIDAEKAKQEKKLKKEEEEEEEQEEEPEEDNVPWQKKYKNRFEQTIQCVIHVNGPYIRPSKMSWSTPVDVTFQTGYTVPDPFPLSLPDKYSSAIFAEFDITKLTADERKQICFGMGYLLSFLSGAGKPEPQSNADIPDHISCKINGDVFNVGYFFNADGKQKLRARDGIDHFLKLEKKAWKKEWTDPRNSGLHVRPGERFILFVVQNQLNNFKKKYKKFHKRKRLATKKKRVGGFNTNPLISHFRLNGRITQMLMTWLTVAHLGLSIFEADNLPHWPNAEQHIKPVMDCKMYMNYIKAVNSMGSGGTLVFSDRPRFKNLMQCPRWEWNANTELDHLEEEITRWIGDDENSGAEHMPKRKADRRTRIQKIVEGAV